MSKILKINVIKINAGQCFISDCNATSGYDFSYHRPQIDKLLFDGKTPIPTHMPNWFVIAKYPDTIQQLITDRKENIRYELIDKGMESDKLPLSIPCEERNNYSDGVIDALYKWAYDPLPDKLTDVDCELSLICEVTNYKDLPKFEFDAIHRLDYSDQTYKITNRNIEHSLIDKIILPAPLLANSPCKLSSKEVYDITRQYIKTHIDTKYANITSDYDFCFEVKKKIMLIEPQTVTYQNIFARTKQERNKIHYATHVFKEKTIFQMTHDQDPHKGYTPVHAFNASNERELKEQLDGFLEDLITVINKPLTQCPHCNGTGYKEEE